MAKIVFIQQDSLFEHFGTEYLSSFLKQNGHEVDMIIENRKKKLVELVRKSNPDLVAFSCTTGIHLWAIDIARMLREELGILNIFGGPHPTFSPEMIDTPGVDIIARGEGEHALLELANCIDGDRDITNIKNLWVKKDGVVHKNPLRPLIQNLDELPFPDRELYSRYDNLKKLTAKKFITGRGCPYSCSFCFNRTLREMYKGKGKYVRRRSVDNVIAEIKTVKENYNLEVVRFSDDTFTFDHKWLFEFCKRYKEEIKVPYECLIRADEVNEQVIKNLKQSGCVYVQFGIESGNERIRKEILNKHITDEQIINTGRLLKKYGIAFGANNMVGLPTETINDIYKTMELNSLIKVDIPIGSILQPFPKTKILSYIQEHDLIEDGVDINTLNDDLFSNWDINISVIKSDCKNEMFNLHKFFYVYVKYPVLRPIIRKIVKLPPNHLFNLMYRMSWVPRVRGTLRISYIDTLKYAIMLLRNVMMSNRRS